MVGPYTKVGSKGLSETRTPDFPVQRIGSATLHKGEDKNFLTLVEETTQTAVRPGKEVNRHAHPKGERYCPLP